MGTVTQKGIGGGTTWVSAVTWLVVTELSPPPRPERVRTGRVQKKSRSRDLGKGWEEEEEQLCRAVTGSPRYPRRQGAKRSHPLTSLSQSLISCRYLLLANPARADNRVERGAGDSRGAAKVSSPASHASLVPAHLQ